MPKAARAGMDNTAPTAAPIQQHLQAWPGTYAQASQSAPPAYTTPNIPQMQAMQQQPMPQGAGVASAQQSQAYAQAYQAYMANYYLSMQQQQQQQP